MVIPKFNISENLQKRIISAGILAPLVLIIVWMGGAVFNTLIVTVAVIMSFEWSGILAAKKNDPSYTEKMNRRWTAAGVAYITLFTASLIYLRSQPSGFGVVLFLLLIVWATDIAAYFSGRMIGGPKIYPKISPNKTWAGLAGGMLAAALIGMFSSVVTHSVSVFSMLVLGAVLAVISQAGDFFESWVKRQFGVKDSGNIIPGHGGLMDRLDGLASVAPVFALISIMTGGKFL